MFCKLQMYTYLELIIVIKYVFYSSAISYYTNVISYCIAKIIFHFLYKYKVSDWFILEHINTTYPYGQTFIIIILCLKRFYNL